MRILPRSTRQTTREASTIESARFQGLKIYPAVASKYPYIVKQSRIREACAPTQRLLRRAKTDDECRVALPAVSRKREKRNKAIAALELCGREAIEYHCENEMRMLGSRMSTPDFIPWSDHNAKRIGRPIVAVMRYYSMPYPPSRLCAYLLLQASLGRAFCTRRHLFGPLLFRPLGVARGNGQA